MSQVIPRNLGYSRGQRFNDWTAFLHPSRFGGRWKSTVGLYSEQAEWHSGGVAEWRPAGSDIIMFCVLSEQGERGQRVWGVIFWLNRPVCVCVCASVFLSVSLFPRVCMCVCWGLACVSSPPAVIRWDSGSMTAHNPHHHPLREHLYPFYPVMCVWLAVEGPRRYVRS